MTRDRERERGGGKKIGAKDVAKEGKRSWEVSRRGVLV